jgi:hypothetical protein
MTVLNCSDYPDFRVGAEQNRTEQNRTEQNRTERNGTERNGTRDTAHFHVIINGGNTLCVSIAHCIECYFEGLTTIYRHIYLLYTI